MWGLIIINNNCQLFIHELLVLRFSVFTFHEQDFCMTVSGWAEELLS